MFRAIAAAAALGAALPSAAGEIRGTVRYRGPVPPAAALEVTKDRRTCGLSMPDESLLVADGKLANAVVQLRGVPGAPPAPAAGTLDQVRCRFEPRVQALPRGSILNVVSSDPILHNVHGWIGRATVLNQAMPEQGKAVARTLERPGIVQVKCDVHDWMAAWVVVTEGPAAVSAADGSFTFRDVPPGSYTAVAWHERLGDLVAEVTVPPRGAATLEFAFGK
jgi:hypothetical protein